MERSAAEQAASLPFVAQRVQSSAPPVGSGFYIMRVDPHGDTVGDILCLLFAALERRGDVARRKPPVATNIDQRSALDGDSQRFKGVRRVRGRDGKDTSVTVCAASERERDGGPLLHDAGRLVLIAILPGDP